MVVFTFIGFSTQNLSWQKHDFKNVFQDQKHKYGLTSFMFICNLFLICLFQRTRFWALELEVWNGCSPFHASCAKEVQDQNKRVCTQKPSSFSYKQQRCSNKSCLRCSFDFYSFMWTGLRGKEVLKGYKRLSSLEEKHSFLQPYPLNSSALSLYLSLPSPNLLYWNQPSRHLILWLMAQVTLSPLFLFSF